MIRSICALTIPFLLFPLFVFAGDENSATSISTTTIHRQPLTIYQNVVGSLESINTPTVASEGTGRILHIDVDAGTYVSAGSPLATIDSSLAKIALDSSQAAVTRLNALIDNQKLSVKRLAKLVKQKSQSQSILDDATAQLKALKAQLDQAQRGTDEASYRLEKTKITAPVSGYIQKRFISKGDFVTIGQPVMAMVTIETLRARFRFPENMALMLHIGQAITMSSPTAPGQVVTATVNNLIPMLDINNRAIEATIDFKNPGQFQPGSSIDGRLTLQEKSDALLVPDTALVSRPNGYVVYEIKNNTAIEHRVATGYRKNGHVEILDGLEADTIIALDGAGFLDNGSSIRLQG